eukprot:8357833-Alexandrium_andersonii.AAC.1
MPAAAGAADEVSGRRSQGNSRGTSPPRPRAIVSGLGFSTGGARGRSTRGAAQALDAARCQAR